MGLLCALAPRPVSLVKPFRTSRFERVTEPAMLFAHAFDRPDLLGRIRRFRKNPVHVYGAAFGLVSAATLIRLGLHQELSSASPFTVYSVATLRMALAGGFYPGMGNFAAPLAK